MNYLILIYEFLKTGLFSVGGGLATMPFLYAMADKYPWFTRELLMDMIAVSESTPGPIGINMATYAGFSALGVPGGIVATLSLILPSMVIMSFLVRALDRFQDNRYVKQAFYGLRPAVTAMITSAGIGLAAATLVNLSGLPNIVAAVRWKEIVLYIVFVTAMRLYKKTQPIWLIAAAAVMGMIFKF